jgi:glycosyltransferase involved in cell wall biosynthesis
VHCKGRADWRAVQQINEIIQEDEINVVHTHGYKADLYGYAAARSSGKPIVATCHNWLGGTAALGIYNRLDRMVLKRFKGIAAVSESVREQLIASGIGESRIKLIANGVDVRAFERPAARLGAGAEEGRVVGMVARLDLQKGFEYLLTAARELCREFNDLKIVVSGEGPDRGAIEKMIAEFGLQHNVVLAGQESDMPAVYAAMDIFVLPSLSEGLPMTVLEAMAASRPVVATRVGAIPSVVRDGESGLLVAPGDAAGLKDALARLLSDRELCSRLGVNAHDWVSRNYTSDTMASRYISMYEEVLGLKNAHAEPQAHALSGTNVRSA